MRRSLLLRLLGLSLAVASFAVVATALLATYGTGSQLRDEVESNTSLLETDSEIRSSLLAYASDNHSWDGVEPLVRELADQTGRRIALTTPAGKPIADSAELLGQGSGQLPSTPAARVDATAPPTPVLQTRLPSSTQTQPYTSQAAVTFASSSGWQLTEQEEQERQALADEAVDCLREEGIEATIYGGNEPIVLSSGRLLVDADESGSATADEPTVTTQLQAHPCVPDELYAPSAATRELNERTVEGTTACLDEHDLTYEVSADSYGMQVVQPTGDEEVSPAWAECEETARVEAMQPYVAPPAELYLGTSDRFDPFSSEGRRRTAATAAVILLAAAVVTVLAGRRLVRPILALTTATQQMEAGDRATRVPVTGNDEVGRLADAFNAMAESLESGDQQRKALVSDVAHELRNPLANVRSYLEAAEVGLVPLDTTLVQALQEESGLLERLVADLQDLALADAGMLRIHPEERDATDLANQAVAAHRTQAEASGVSVRVDAPGPVPVHVDPGRLRQALGNLVANAVTHTPPGGTVEVAVRQTGGSVVLTVIDTGAGIAPEHLPHVFDRFYRADPSRSRTTGGSGLGLAITKHLVEAHHGHVEATSTVGQGSVFTIRLPHQGSGSPEIHGK